jgi:hypothetical protein
MNIWKIFTPLHPSQGVVFLGIFEIFYFFEFKFKILNLTGIEPTGTGTGPVRFHRFPRYPDRFQPVPFNPG